MTGSHHEYWSRQMLDAVESYLADGGRWMSLTGNGYYWPIGIDPDRPHLLEIRRGQNGTGTWRSAPGENWLQTIGEPGGLWRDRGRAPQRLVGVGMSAAGFDRAHPFRRLPASYDPRAAFIFAGIGDDEPIGDVGLMMGGAAGFEIDRADPRPGHAAARAGRGHRHAASRTPTCGPSRRSRLRRATGRPRQPGRARRHGLLRDAQRRRRLRRRLDHLVRQSLPQRLRQSGLPHHRQRAARLVRPTNGRHAEPEVD